MNRSSGLGLLNGGTTENCGKPSDCNGSRGAPRFLALSCSFLRAQIASASSRLCSGVGKLGLTPVGALVNTLLYVGGP